MRATLFLLLLAAPPAAGDGMVIAREMLHVEMPGQSALLHWENGLERLVIESAFQGPGTEFAWIIPVPVPPRIGVATTGLFPTLAVLTRPHLVYDVEPLWPLALLVLIVILLSWAVAGKRGELILRLLLVVSMLAALGAGVVLFVARGDEAARQTLGVTVHAVTRVGSYDTATIPAGDPAALRSWLESSGFRPPAEAIPVMEAYAREGWSFFVAKLRGEELPAAARAAHPLVLEFASPEPVYPLRLTGAASPAPLSLDLYVFGPSRAAPRGFETLWCDEAGALGALHPEILRLGAGGRIVTKLRASLAPASMGRDLTLRWEPLARVRAEFHTLAASRERAMNFGLGAAFALWAAVALADHRARKRRWGRAFAAWLGGAGVGLVVHLATPHAQGGAFDLRLMVHGSDGHTFRTAFHKSPPATLEAARALVATLALGPNPCTGLPTREEDSPGNYTLREKAGTILPLFYDAWGEPAED